MKAELSITAAQVEPDLIDLPWSYPLETWPKRLIAALPRGISRHVVRFVRLGGKKTIAVKEISEPVAFREYELLRSLVKLNLPTVTPTAVVTGRVQQNGEPLNACLITDHLPYSLPYRAVIGHDHRREAINRLIDALAVLMVRLHLAGFFWGDVSLSNTLFRRDAGSFAAYLVDAETGELFDPITDGKRHYDTDVARTNIIGELMDLIAGGILPEDFDAISVGDYFEKRYHELWDEVTAVTTIGHGEKWKVTDRVQRLNRLGFDVDELSITTHPGASQLNIQPKVVEAGHYARKVERLAGLNVEENQARRILNDIGEYAATNDLEGQPESTVAHAWLRDVYEPTIAAIPPELSGKLEPAEIFHEILEHRWFISERQGRDVPQAEAVQSFITEVLQHRRDEKAFLDATEPEILPEANETPAGADDTSPTPAGEEARE
ncbi:Lipopolysaccharide kinase (Kdo/WaaP) family protein [Actinobaculum suis]|uniref:DUF4032 domain-containing protein n=1 Tax=Actinobaculum suis TaxID=1657 RepID=A0A1B9BAB9_9ACTO|nr:DUF4032 domain-containing protein [Actinobaculum suis]MDY5153663.1 DUF4032 domain-containing protein [Actinobaculum suis]OCA93039.1 lipopolysaccharide kinase [Actinobaculum suis]OCA93198.1 lipopolysaccharide kinase [Actinobaculum suis]SDE22210.1 Lipopolysaccharide kinase (Kdo/WaaP) family protein [Actinobaculum suis]VDG75740.1 Lipopolysaccharide kinase (Kdo/WaaP) family [Actinobaculum suis]